MRLTLERGRDGKTDGDPELEERVDHTAGDAGSDERGQEVRRRETRQGRQVGRRTRSSQGRQT